MEGLEVLRNIILEYQAHAAVGARFCVSEAHNPT